MKKSCILNGTGFEKTINFEKVKNTEKMKYSLESRI